MIIFLQFIHIWQNIIISLNKLVCVNIKVAPKIVNRLLRIFEQNFLNFYLISLNSEQDFPNVYLISPNLVKTASLSRYSLITISSTLSVSNHLIFKVSIVWLHFSQFIHMWHSFFFIKENKVAPKINRFLWISEQTYLILLLGPNSEQQFLNSYLIAPNLVLKPFYKLKLSRYSLIKNVKHLKCL